LCENEEIIDPIIYEQIVNLKNELANNKSKLLFFYTRFKNSKQLEELFDNVILTVNSRIAEGKLYLRAIKTADISHEKDEKDEPKEITQEKNN